MTDRIVVVTKMYSEQNNEPFTKADLQFCFDLLERGGYHPVWMHRNKAKQNINKGWIVVRNARRGDPDEIVSSLFELTETGWMTYGR